MSVSFTIEQDGGAAKQLKIDDAAKPVRLGRAAANELVIGTGNKNVSSYHAELWLVGTPPRLCVRDLSMNGTGLKYGEDEPIRCEKGKDVPLSIGALLIVPLSMKSKTADAGEKVSLKICSEDPILEGGARAEINEVPAESTPAPSNNDRQAGDVKALADTEDNRMRFAQLLIQCQKISKKSSYDEVKRILSSTSDWTAVDEKIRREGYQVFVDAWRNSNGKKGTTKKAHSENNSSNKRKAARRHESERDRKRPSKKEKRQTSDSDDS